jgi:hypothetical protein
MDAPRETDHGIRRIMAGLTDEHYTHFWKSGFQVAEPSPTATVQPLSARDVQSCGENHQVFL